MTILKKIAAFIIEELKRQGEIIQLFITGEERNESYQQPFTCY